MKALYVLIVAFTLAVFILKIVANQKKVHKGIKVRATNWNKIDYALAGSIAMACMLIFTAIGHFVFSYGMAAMIPKFIPYKLEIVYITAIMEVSFAITLLFKRYRQLSAWLLIVFLILVLPANIKAAIEHINYETAALNGKGLNYLWIRIPMQLLFICWTYFFCIKKTAV